MLILAMMMMAANRNKQQQQNLQQQQENCVQVSEVLQPQSLSSSSSLTNNSQLALGKGSNSSDDTVIARFIEPPAAKQTEKVEAEHTLESAPEVNSSDTIQNTKQQTSVSTEEIGANRKQQQRGKFKRFLLLTAHHLNPFQQQQNQEAKVAIDPERDCIAGKGSAQANGRPGNCSGRHRSYLQLLGLSQLQRYFGGGRRRSVEALNGEQPPTNRQPTGSERSTKSAPVTPVRLPAKSTAGEAAQVDERDSIKLANGYSAKNNGELPNCKQQVNSLLTTNNKPSVRFVESSLNNKCDADEKQEAAAGNEDKKTNIVAKLFKLPDLSGSTSGESPMDSAKFRQYGYSLIDYISNYLDTIDQRRVTPLNIEPGYLKELIQPDAPQKGESFASIMHDFEDHIMCGITHWQHPHFHAYFPAGNAYPSILADMLSDALGCVGFSWAASPAYTELEIIMLDWMGKMIGLPDEFLCLSGSSRQQNPKEAEDRTATGSESKGGGVIQGSASECVLVSLLAARHWAMEKLRRRFPGAQDGLLLSKLIGYCSKEAHSCVEKAAMIGFIRMRALDTDEKHSLRGETLAKAIALDLAHGLEPFIVCATLGTTSCCSFDNLEELGQVCREHDDLWLHVDAAYAGSALICPEFKYLMRGIERATSFNMNPNKWMLINFDCSLMWVKDRFKLTRAFVVDPLYLQHSFSDQAIDYRHWGVPLSRRFRALKLWFVIRNYGVEGLQAYIRNHVRLAKLFEERIRQDARFTITNQVTLGLVCFRLVGSNALNQRLLSMINASGKLHMVPASLNGRYVIRFCVCDKDAKEEDILYAFQCISDFATELFESIKAGKERIRAISQQNTIDVSNISLHRQQSASADRLNNMASQQLPPAIMPPPSSGTNSATSGRELPQAPGQPTPSPQSPQREAARQYLVMRRNSRGSGLGPSTGEQQQPLPVSARTSPAQLLQQQLSAKSPLVKQASVSVAGASQPNATGTGSGSATSNFSAPDEDLEQEIVLDSLATIDGYDYDLDDDDLLPEPPLSAAGDSAEGGASGELATSTTENNNGELFSDCRSPVARHWSSRAGRGSRNNQTMGGAPGERDEAEDEVFTLAERRQRMSLRYKREFFVRVVSDPRVYRASISGDINAHSSSCSLASGGGCGAGSLHHPMASGACQSNGIAQPASKTPSGAIAQSADYLSTQQTTCSNNNNTTAPKLDQQPSPIPLPGSAATTQQEANCQR